MLSFNDFLLNKVILEIKYKDGYRYWDKSGDTLIKIQKEDSDWKWRSLGDKGMEMINDKRKIRTFFDWNRVWIEQVFVDNLGQFKINSDKLTKIVLNNFEIREISRIGNRYWFLLPCETVEDAEKLIDKGEILQPKEDKIAAFGKRVINRDFTLVVEDDDINYRIAIGSASRPKGIEAGRDKLFKQFNPENAVLVDIDAFTTKISKADDFVVSDYIQRTFKKIENNIIRLFK